MPENLKPVSLAEFEARRSQGDKDFRYSYFSDISISGDLVGFDFTGSRFMSCDFAFADMSKAKFIAATINSDFHSSKVAMADFSQGTLYWGFINSCDFTHAKFCDATLKHIRFEVSDLSHADFTGSTLDGSRFTRLIGAEAVIGTDKMLITQGGATDVEVENLRRHVLTALVQGGHVPEADKGPMADRLAAAQQESDRRAGVHLEPPVPYQDRGRG